MIKSACKTLWKIYTVDPVRTALMTLVITEVVLWQTPITPELHPVLFKVIGASYMCLGILFFIMLMERVTKKRQSLIEDTMKLVNLKFEYQQMKDNLASKIALFEIEKRNFEVDKQQFEIDKIANGYGKRQVCNEKEDI